MFAKSSGAGSAASGLVLSALLPFSIRASCGLPISQDRDHRRHLSGEPQLRSSLRPVSRRQRHRQRDARSSTRSAITTARCCPTCAVWDSHGKADPAFPELPNAPFRIDAPPVGLSADQVLLSPIHAYYHNIEQINGGRNDMFAAMSTVGGYTMGYFDGSRMKLWQWAKEFTLADNFFMGAFGGSYLNHQYLICACTPVFKDAPPSACARSSTPTASWRRSRTRPPRATAPCRPTRAAWAARSRPTASPSTRRSRRTSRAASLRPTADAGAGGCQGHRAPGPAPAAADEQDDRRHAVGQGRQLGLVCGRLERRARGRTPPPRREAHVIYTRENDALNFQPHHQPFNYFARFAPGTPDRDLHLKDGEDFLRDIDAGRLPPVVFYKPPGASTSIPPTRIC